MAISAVSESRISPTMTTSGSWRRIERKPLAKVKLRLGRTGICATPGQFVFDRVLDGQDFLFRRVNALQNGIKRGGLAAARRAGGQKKPVRLLHQPGQQRRRVGIQPQLLGGEQLGVFLQQPHDQAFAINGGHGADPDVHPAPRGG